MPAALESGVPDPDRAKHQAYGFLADGAWFSHAWARCRDLIVDITNDQFGGTKVTVIAAPDKRYKPGIDDATTLSLSARGVLAVEKLMLDWRNIKA